MTAVPLPSGLTRGLNFVVPDDWTPEQALAVFELLDDLRELICARYLPDMQRVLRGDRRQRELPLTEHDPPF
ncbi:MULTISPECIES: hypothetical protein [Burkholderia]|uniref:Uncharacterized protein n=1 Tax=Burkholderia mayonis TaxID=1385591 RepID=A0A1B4FEP9_9BURK|nr:MULTISPECIES: hypothetical protein [Burkholderia]AOJ00865.1 hypothetical protein WS70_02710 [Burkholderia mayonis]AOJ02042.1 hypothetical protein WS70_09580 [Burkholderia mayonis]AOJ02251.1 hypothetical protein WS70_10785 [Burkholderia mayonis]AOJ02379.1 hypothetical protein WS70_11505 [Burkholderia mayonis]AOJ02824.1 hypothetical protein WS70_14120 [Burkholderia mayonis]